MLTTSAKKSTGHSIAAMLAGIWRAEQSALSLSADELLRIAPSLIVSGAGGLGWWRIRRTPFESSEAAKQLHQSFRLQTLYAAQYEQELIEILSLLRAEGIDPVLIKGWSIARHYPRTSLRPYGDIDLCVSPHSYERARAVIESQPGKNDFVDLHNGFATIDTREFGELYARSGMKDLNGTPVRVLAAEDELRALCMHMLRHGAWRPLWLCDVSIALENRPADFDWDRCLGDARERHLVECVIGLAHQLLDARIDDTPVAAKHLPRWLAPSVIKSWNNPSSDFNEPQRLAHTYVRDPRGVLEGMRLRWRTPVRATVEMKAPFNDLPRMPFQIAHYLKSTSKFALRQLCFSQETENYNPHVKRLSAG